MQISGCAEPCLQTGTVNPTSESFWALVLAGGDGTRLQSVTRVIAGAPIPKQYCRILGSRSLLETTLRRIAPLVAAERTLAIINRDHLTIARPQLTNLDVRNVLVQPRNLDTGPGLLVGMLELARRDPEATVAIFPSDHYIRDGGAFRRSVERMRHVVAAHPEKIALLGARCEQGLDSHRPKTEAAMTDTSLDTLCANTIRTLAMDAAGPPAVRHRPGDVGGPRTRGGPSWPAPTSAT